MIENKIIKLNVNYNWQLDNFGFTKISAGSQCGYTSACVVLSARIADAANDWFVKDFVMSMDRDYITGKSDTRRGASQNNYKALMDEYLKNANSQYRTIVRPNGGTLDDIINALKSGSPVMASTMLTSSGHYIPIIGINTEKKFLICNDPYGLFDFKKGKYVKVNATAGKEVEYKFDDIIPYMEKSTKAVFGDKAVGLRILWVG